MFALIVSTDGEDKVHIGSREKLEKKAIEIIEESIDLDSPTWTAFGQAEVEKLLMEMVESGDSESCMELFADISDARGEMVFMRIVSAEMELDA